MGLSTSRITTATRANNIFYDSATRSYALKGYGTAETTCMVAFKPLQVLMDKNGGLRTSYFQ